MVIIKPRMPRILGTKRRVGQFGARSLQRSMIHVRRMLISRLPESLSVDLQQATEQPLGWDALPEAQEIPQLSGPVVEAPHRTRSQSRLTTQQQSAQRSADTDNRMPPDLQAIFDLHKRLGRVESNPNLKSQAEVFNKSGGTILRVPEEPSPPVQRAVEEKSTPASEPRRRQVRSKVEYVNRPDPDMVRRSREAPDAQPEVDDTSVDDAPLDEEYDFVNTFPPDDFADNPADTQQSIQHAVDRAEAPLRSDTDSPSESYSETYTEHDADSYSDAPPYLDEPSATRQSIQRAEDRAETPLQRDADAPPEAYSEAHDDYNAESYSDVQWAVDRAEAPLRRDIDAPADSYAASYGDYDSDDHSEAWRDVDEPAATQQSVQRAADRTEAPAETHDEYAVDDSAAYTDDESDVDTEYHQPIQRDTDDALQRAIEAAESPPESYPTMLDYESDTQPTSVHDTARTTPIQRDVDDDAYTQTFIEPTQRRMTISDPQPPTQIQRTSLPEHLSVEQDAFGGADVEDDYSASEDLVYGDYDIASADATVQPARDDIQRYEEQDIDLGEALFGGDEPVQRRPVPEHDGPTPTLMPPIGKLRHTRPLSEQSMPRQVARRTDREEDQEVSPLDLMRMASASLDADIARDEAIHAAERPSSVQMSRDEEADTPDDHEAQLLTLLDLPADTPIQRGGIPMPTPATSTVQRELEDDRGNVEGEAPPEGESSKSLDEQAQEVYDILKRKLRIENERYKGKK